MSLPSRLDLVIFGASGYTGKCVVKELIRIVRSYPDVKWAVAGRDKRKLETLLRDVAMRTGADLTSIRIILADVDDDNSLKDMCHQAKVLINCCGPFIKYGEAVVAAAVHCKTHYVDVSAETQFMELLEQKYDQPARETGVYIISACGLVSIPADLGVLFLEQNFGGTLNSVESYLLTYFPAKTVSEAWRNGIIRYSSWESTINSMASVSMKKIREKPSFHFESERKQRCFIHRNLNKWCLQFPGTDGYVVQRTQRHLLAIDKKRPIQYHPYLTLSSIFVTIGIIIGCMILFVLSKMSCSRRFLLKYPKLCSLGLVTYEDPKEGLMDDSWFQYQMFGKGWEAGMDVEKRPNKEVVARVSVSGADPAYAGTAVAVIFAAITILKEKDKMASTCGVLTPGIAFRKTNILKHLHENNIKFEIVNNS